MMFAKRIIRDNEAKYTRSLKHVLHRVRVIPDEEKIYDVEKERQKMRDTDAIRVQMKETLLAKKWASDLTYDDVGKFFEAHNRVAVGEIPRLLANTDWEFRALHVGEAQRKAILQEMKKPQYNRVRVKSLIFRKDEEVYLPPRERYLLARQCTLDLTSKLESVQNKDEKSFARLLIGPRGAGKSCTLLHSVVWARERGWLTMYFPRTIDYISEQTVSMVGTREAIPFIMGSTLGQDFYQLPNGAQHVLQITNMYNGPRLAGLPQRRKYDHGLYTPKTGKPTLAHILARGLESKDHAADALYDLRMEFNLVEEYPVLIAVDEYNALYWPTCYWYKLKTVDCHKIVNLKAFRFIKHWPGDIEDDSNPKTTRYPALDPQHLPRYGAVIGATVLGKTCPPHDTRIVPIVGDEPHLEIENVERQVVPPFDYEETSQMLSWYYAKGLLKNMESLTEKEILARRSLTAGVAEYLFLSVLHYQKVYYENYEILRRFRYKKEFRNK